MSTLVKIIKAIEGNVKKKEKNKEENKSISLKASTFKAKVEDNEDSTSEKSLMDEDM